MILAGNYDYYYESKKQNNNTSIKITMSCPVDNTELSYKEIDEKYTNIQFCPKCRREFYPTEPKENNERLEEYSDLETVSEEGGGEPVLLCDDSDLRGFPKEYLKRKNKNESYLYEHFEEHVNIETREYIPT